MVAARSATHSAAMPTRAAPIKVFLADDSPLICDRITALLCAAGMTVVGHADSPQSCFDGILAGRPDVVVLDVQLDGGSGLEVLRTVRLAAPDVAFVVFSNNSCPAYRRRYLAEGALQFVDKSTEFHQLAPAVARACGHALTH
jgi:DNA-binding NarL/FixJ family response regulator